MQQQGVLDNYKVPEVAQKAFAERGAMSMAIGNGVQMVQMHGHEAGVPYQFHTEQIRNDNKSKAAKYWVPDPIDCITWTVDRRLQVTERVKFLPPELLEFDEDGTCIGGRYKESFDNWKKGLNAPGLSLSKWGELGDGEVLSLAHAGIFSVEQLASMPRDKLANRYPEIFLEAWEKAVQWVNRKEQRVDTELHASQIVELQKLLSQRDREAQGKDKQFQELQAQVAALMSGNNGREKLEAEIEKTAKKKGNAK